MTEHNSPFSAAVAAIRPLLLGLPIRQSEVEQIAFAALRAAKAAADKGHPLSCGEQLAAANERAEKAEAERDDARAQLRTEMAITKALLADKEELAMRAHHAEVGRDEARARLAELGEATEWGQPRTEWHWSVRKPDGAAIPPMYPDPHPPRTEESVRREFDGVVENMGYRKVLLRREVTAWRDAKTADAAQDGRSGPVEVDGE